MQRRQYFTFCLISLFSWLMAMGCSARVPLAMSGGHESQSTVTTLTVSAAASLQEALDAIAPQFQAIYPTIAIDYNFASSGALQQQIEQGAPVDIFFSAATKQMDALAKKDLILGNSRQNLVANDLVLVAPADSKFTITEIAQLKDANIRHFAVGEFRSVPAGQYAEQMFKNLDLLESLRSKFVFGNNVRSVLAAVESGNAQLGMVYATDAALSSQITVLATAPQDTHAPILYPIATVSGTPHATAAQTFIDFLTTDTAQTIFAEFGFSSV